MIRTRTKISIVLALTLGALAVPCVAWWAVGSRSAEAGAQRALEAPVIAARETADDLARRLGSRLEELRESESARPFQHYVHQYHGAGDDCGCPAGVTSPLAAGRAHPLIAAHFQIDDLGRVSLPTLGGAAPAGSDAGWLDEQHALLDLLASASPSLLEDDEG
ncbi:MAG: hypothetical protein R3344_03355, partial [Acidobacteriota bacterium]|nr:hypothetical protein [Acidobacteriota bacterium]